MADQTKTSRALTLEQYVSKRVAFIQKAYRDPNRSAGAAWLAELRRSGTQPGVSPHTWILEFGDFPPELKGRSDQASNAERAAHLAFTLYATHQQSQSEPMHRSGREFGLGRAVALLQQRQSSESPGQLPTRFAALGTTSDFDEISHYARQLITQLRAEKLPLDYGRLANQLYRLLNPLTADAVRREWGRDFVGGFAALRHNNPVNHDRSERRMTCPTGSLSSSTLSSLYRRATSTAMIPVLLRQPSSAASDGPACQARRGSVRPVRRSLI